jgi:polyphenol oxidase
MVDVLHADWPAPAAVRALQTRRGGGVSSGAFASLNLGDHVGDDPLAVAANRRRLGAALQLPAEPQWLDQVHGTRVVALPDASSHPQADACWAVRPGVVCAVLTADCLPVLLCADDGSAVAAAHAGWRGLAAGVLEATVAALPAPPGRCLAWFGAAIGPAAFEVGPEVRAALIAADAGCAPAFTRGREDRWHADLYALARRRLLRAGVGAVYGGGLCTAGDAAAWFSHRRDGRSGRMASLIWIDRAAA